MKKTMLMLVTILALLSAKAQNSFPTPTGAVEINNKSITNRLVVQEITEPNGESLVSLITGQQRGLLVKDRANMTGGLCLFGGGTFTNPSNAGGVGAGFASDMLTYIPLTNNNSAITFLDGNINFFATKGLTVGQAYYPTPKMFLDGSTGNMGIGTTSPGTYKLAVEGKLGAREIRVTTAPWADFVFTPTYHLRSLPEVETFIKENGHLPEVPTEAEIKKEGNDLAKTDAVLLQKVEELTLYLIEQNKTLENLKKANEALKSKLEALEASKK